MLHVASNSSKTTGSACNLVSILHSISIYRALKKLVFRHLPQLGFSGTFDVIEDMFLDQEPLKNLLL